MNRLRNLFRFWLMLLALASGLSVAALKLKPSPEFSDEGATLDVSDWSFRKSVTISNTGPQQFDLDLDVLANSQSDFSDLRLMHGGEQIPYLIDPAAGTWYRKPVVVATNDAQNPTVSRWIMHLERPHLPVTEVRCDTATALFERDMTLYEIRHDSDHGDAFRQVLANGKWTKTPATASKSFSLTLNPPPLTDTLILETRNGDNPPIQLGHFLYIHALTRIFFEAQAGEQLYLYYGNSAVSAPHYDLNLVSAQLRSANKSTAILGREESLKKSRRPVGMLGIGRRMFWGILALVVVVLLVVIARLLPKTDDQPPK